MIPLCGAGEDDANLSSEKIFGDQGLDHLVVAPCMENALSSMGQGFAACRKKLPVA